MPETQLPRNEARLNRNWSEANPTEVFDKREVDFSQFTGIEEVGAIKPYPDESRKVLSVLVGALELGGQVLDFPHDKTEIIIQKLDNEYGARVSDEGELELYINASTLNNTLVDVALYLTHKEDIEKHAHLRNKPESLEGIAEFQSKASMRLLNAIFGIAHECYHLGQAVNNKPFYDETRKSNDLSSDAIHTSTLIKFLPRGNKRVEGKTEDEWKQEAKNIMARDRGERAGLGFGVLMLKKIHAAISDTSSENEMVRLFESEYQAVVDAWTKRLQEDFQTSKSS